MTSFCQINGKNGGSMEIENILNTITVCETEVSTVIELSEKIEKFGPMHLTMILVD